MNIIKHFYGIVKSFYKKSLFFTKISKIVPDRREFSQNSTVSKPEDRFTGKKIKIPDKLLCKTGKYVIIIYYNGIVVFRGKKRTVKR